jgi:hypothetical protein
LSIRLRDFLTELPQEVWQLERKVTAGHMGRNRATCRVIVSGMPLISRTPVRPVASE